MILWLYWFNTLRTWKSRGKKTFPDMRWRTPSRGWKSNSVFSDKSTNGQDGKKNKQFSLFWILLSKGFFIFVLIASKVNRIHEVGSPAIFWTIFLKKRWLVFILENLKILLKLVELKHKKYYFCQKIGWNKT